jgi:hypothetical protein
LRIESSKIIATLAKTRRANETLEQKVNRIKKWQKNFYNKTLEEKTLIWKRNLQTRIINETVTYFICSCISCRSTTKNINRHKCKIPKVKILKIPKIKIIPIKQILNYTCPICDKTNFRNETFYNIHIIKCQIRYNNKIEKEQARKNRLCTICFKQFNSKLWFDKHIEIGTCHLPIEEQKRISRNKARQTMNSKSIEEKEIYGQLISQKRKIYLQSLSEEELILYHNKLRKSALAYYDSTAYNPAIRSQQIKEGLKNDKHSKN